MEKINGKMENMSEDLALALGRKPKILGIATVVEYKIKITDLDKDDLYRHGMDEYNIRPSRGKNARATFEKNCMKAFRDKTGQAGIILEEPKKLKIKNQKALEAVLSKIRPQKLRNS